MSDNNLVWPMGEDLFRRYIYREGADENSLVAIDLTSGYAVRMDIVDAKTGARIYTFNSEEIEDVDPIATGAQPDAVTEVTFGNGSSGPNIIVKVPRSLTLPGGAVYQKLFTVPPVKVFAFDVFLRNTQTDTQVKIDKGTIIIERSYTLWP